MEAATLPHLALARTLPQRLLRFFAVNPPKPPTSPPMPTDPVEIIALERHAKPKNFNPFLPHKHPRTHRWHPPIYSLRRQAELVKLAKKYDVEDLLPYTPKKTEEKERRRIERGLRVKGTGEGERVKGHEWERTMKSRLEKRRQAMIDMPRLVQEWKQRGHGRGFTKFPSGKSGRTDRVGA